VYTLPFILSSTIATRLAHLSLRQFRSIYFLRVRANAEPRHRQGLGRFVLIFHFLVCKKGIFQLGLSAKERRDYTEFISTRKGCAIPRAISNEIFDMNTQSVNLSNRYALYPCM